MQVKLDIYLKQKVYQRKFDGREIKLLYEVLESLEKSPSGQNLKSIYLENDIIKLMEKRATRSYRVYFLMIVQKESILIVDISKKKFQKHKINEIMKMIEEIINRNN